MLVSYSYRENIGKAIQSIVTPLFLPIVERNLIPDAIVRLGIRLELSGDFAEVKKLSSEKQLEKEISFVKELKSLPIAIKQDSANEQHYEVPDSFHRLYMGPCMKYSSCYFENPTSTLEEAEIAMLEMYCERAGLIDGMSIVDLGCGWGSVTLFLGGKYPNSKITSISNSNSQREFIQSTAAARGYKNITVYTGDISEFDLPEKIHSSFDRVITIEMMEHMKNYSLLLKKISNWLKPGGKLFIHVFTAKHVPSHFEKGWMAETFFTGGTMMSDRLLLYFQEDLRIESHWRVNGSHYQRTLEAWLTRMDARKAEVLPLLEATYGQGNGLKWYVNWRLFFIACAEFFGYDNGEEWFVSHYLFTKPIG